MPDIPAEAVRAAAPDLYEVIWFAAFGHLEQVQAGVRWRNVPAGHVTARCPYCRLKGVWSMAGGAEVDGNLFTPPKGHTVVAVDGNSAHRTDTCPVAKYDPRPPWRRVDWTRL